MSWVVLKACGVLALCGLLGACEEAESRCRAACSSSLEVALHREEWPAGEYVLMARYDAHRTSYVYTCTFTLPGGADATCDDERAEIPEVEISVGATITLDIPAGPSRIALELQPPEGAMKSLALEPEYETYELCGQTCGDGFVSASFDDTSSP